jgi:hypothetical protein
VRDEDAHVDEGATERLDAEGKIGHGRLGGVRALW